MTYIYTLNCPTTNEVRYVGRSIDPNRRYYAHLRTDNTASTYKVNWVQSLLKNGLKPYLLILGKVPLKEAHWYEKEVIKYFKVKGCRLTNCTEGGDGLLLGNKTSFKPGQIPWNKGSRKKKTCAVCGKLFEVSPSGDKKYSCCCIGCSSIYRSRHPNKGTFVKGSIPSNITPVVQLDRTTLEPIREFSSITQAQKELGITHITCVINGRRPCAGGYKWKRR